MSRWLEVCIPARPETADALSEKLVPYAEMGSVAQEQLGDPADLNPFAMLPTINLKIYVAEADDTADLRATMAALAHEFEAAEPIYILLEETDWANAWKVHYEPLRLGTRFWLRPSWIDEPAPHEDDLLIKLDPGMAFGTGQHETTQLCLELMEEVLVANPEVDMLDLGTGSGILAIAAALLGVPQIDAYDIDPVATAAALENVTDNGVADQIFVDTGGVSDVRGQSYDVVVVNILAVIIMSMLQEGNLMGYGHAQSRFVFSGIVNSQLPGFVAVLTAVGGEVIKVIERGDWVAVLAQKKKG